MNTSIKALVAIVISAAGALVTALGTGSTGSIANIDATHWIIAALTVLGSGGVVYFCENGPEHPYIKTVVAFLSAGLGSLVIALNDQVITQSEWLTAFIAAVTATGLVYQATGAPKTPQP